MNIPLSHRQLGINVMAKERYTRKTSINLFVHNVDFISALNANGVFTLDGLLSKPFKVFMESDSLRPYWDEYVDCVMRLFQLVRYDNFTL